MLKYNNYLQRYLKQKLLTKVINMPSLKAWVKRPIGLIKRSRKCKRFKREYLDKGRKCFIGANITYQSKSLPDKVVAIDHAPEVFSHQKLVF